MFSLNAVLIAMTVPDISDLIALVGAIASSALGLVIPPLLETICFWDTKKKLLWFLPWPFWIGKNVFILLVGLTAAVLGVYSSLKKISENFLQENEDHCTLYYLEQ